MIAESDAVEVWFEHKVASKENVYSNDDQTVGQVEKYVDAAGKRHVANGKRIWIVYCCRDETQILNRESLPGPTDSPVALANPTAWALRWHSLHDQVVALADKAYLAERPRWLVQQLLTHWRSIPRMWLSPTGARWAVERDSLKPDETAWLREMWTPVKDLLEDRCNTRPTNGDKGHSVYLMNCNGPIAQVWLNQARASDFAGWDGPSEVLRCDLTISGGAKTPLLDSFERGRRLDSHGRTVLIAGLPVGGWDPSRGARACGEDLRDLLRPLLDKLPLEKLTAQTGA